MTISRIWSKYFMTFGEYCGPMARSGSISATRTRLVEEHGVNRMQKTWVVQCPIARTPQRGLKPKDLIGVAWILAMALQLDGWYLRSDIIWYKPNCQPESVKDRVTVSHEYIFMLSKSENYYFDQESIKERTTDGKSLKNKRTVWQINTEPCKEAHFAVFPRALVHPCILAGSPQGGLVLDPFFGSGTVGVVAIETGRRCVGVELKSDYIDIAKQRLLTATPTLDLDFAAGSQTATRHEPYITPSLGF